MFLPRPAGVLLHTMSWAEYRFSNRKAGFQPLFAHLPPPQFEREYLMSNRSTLRASKVLGPIMRSVLDAAIAVDSHGFVVAWNDVAALTFGWAATEAVGRPLDELIIPGRHRAGHQAGMHRYQQTGEARVVNRLIEIAAVNKAGREFPVELSIVATPDAGEAAFIGFLRDISGRRSALERLAVSEESLRLTTEAAEIGTWDLDLVTNVLGWSDRTKGMFGILPETPCSMDDFYGGLHPDDRQATSDAFALALNPAVRASYDVQYRTVGKEDGRVGRQRPRTIRRGRALLPSCGHGHRHHGP